MTEREKNLLILILIAPLFVAVALALIAGLLRGAGDWLVAHQILVGPSEAVVYIPGLDGRGLDSMRLILVMLSGMVLIAGLAWAAARRHARLRRAAMQ